jgi:hypothetical protein
MFHINNNITCADNERQSCLHFNEVVTADIKIGAVSSIYNVFTSTSEKNNNT